MYLYAIRQISTGYFLPYRKSSKGFTSDEPVKDCMPRFFKKKQHAVVALKCWLQGKWEYSSYSNHWDGLGEIELVINKAPYRKTEDMEIVTITYVVVEDVCKVTKVK